MSTISSMARTNSTIANLAASGIISTDKVGASTGIPSKIESGNSNPAYSLSQSLNSILNDKGGSSQISAMWNTYLGQTSNSSSNMLTQLNNAYTQGQQFANELISQKNTMSELVKSYAETKDAFNSQLAGSLDDLAYATSKMRGNGYYVQGYTQEDTQKNVADVVKNVKEFVSAYNDTNGFFNDNKEVSNRVAGMAKSFGDNSYYANTLNTVGISVGKNGALSLDESRLTNALTNNNDAASYVLDSLANRAADKTVKAAGQMDKLFPSISSMMGSNYESTKQLYSPNTMIMTNRYENVGSMLNLLA